MEGYMRIKVEKNKVWGGKYNVSLDYGGRIFVFNNGSDKNPL